MESLKKGIYIYNRKDIIGIVPIRCFEGLWGCHTDNLPKYKKEFDKKNIKPLYFVRNMQEKNRLFKSKNLNVYGQKSKFNII